MLDNLSVGAKIIILIIIAVVVVVAIVLGFLYFRQEPEDAQPPTVINEQEPPPRQPIVPEVERKTIDLPKLTEEEKSEEQLQTLARVFAERFGTFSNQAGFTNLDDIQSLLTEEMQQWVAAQKTQMSKKYPLDSEYYGVTTSAPIVKTDSYSQDKAVMLVTTQRTEKKNSESKTFEQKIKVEFVNIDGNWLINGAYWQ